MNDQGCDIFVRFEGSLDQLVNIIHQKVQGELKYWRITTPVLSIDIEENDDYDREEMDGEDGFLNFPYYLEVSQPPEVEYDIFVQTVCELMAALVHLDFSPVAACDFEEEIAQFLAREKM